MAKVMGQGDSLARAACQLRDLLNIVAALTAIKMRLWRLRHVERSRKIHIPVVVDRHVRHMDLIAPPALDLIQQQRTDATNVGQLENYLALGHGPIMPGMNQRYQLGKSVPLIAPMSAPLCGG
jgi:hypothetical protein